MQYCAVIVVEVVEVVEVAEVAVVSRRAKMHAKRWLQ
jgi:hypothetical protein